MTLTVEQEDINGTTNLKLIGQLDTNTAGDLEKTVKTLLAGKEPSILFDCSQLTYLSSYGLRVIVFTAKAMRSKKNRFVVHSLLPDVTAILKMGGFLTLMKVAADKDAALGLLNS